MYRFPRSDREPMLRGSPRLFDPRRYGTVVGWYRWDAWTPVDNASSSVAVIRDLSGNGNHLTFRSNPHQWGLGRWCPDVWRGIPAFAMSYSFYTGGTTVIPANGPRAALIVFWPSPIQPYGIDSYFFGIGHSNTSPPSAWWMGYRPSQSRRCTPHTGAGANDGFWVSLDMNRPNVWITSWAQSHGLARVWENGTLSVQWSLSSLNAVGPMIGMGCWLQVPNGFRQTFIGFIFEAVIWNSDIVNHASTMNAILQRQYRTGRT